MAPAAASDISKWMSITCERGGGGCYNLHTPIVDLNSSLNSSIQRRGCPSTMPEYECTEQSRAQPALTPRRSARAARSAMRGRHRATAPRLTYFKYSRPEAPVGPDR